MELTPLYQKNMTCTLCQHSFKTTKIRGRFVRATEHSTDLMPIYQDPALNPNLYHVHVCPECGYSFTDDFAPYFPPGGKEEIEEKISTHWQHLDFSGERSLEDAIKAYKLAIYIAMIKKEKSITLAGLYLRLSWLYRGMNNEQEQRFQRLAVETYKEAYSKEDYKGSQITTERVLYLIAELSLRLGEDDEATRHFSKIIERQHSSTDRKMVHMAKERWQMYREERPIKRS
ncbi:hypothetical protein JMA_26040 [Jeotgalibacillus malaysiensis]|uniref:DUF2225 domain-containing protein n=1 Tax=Jeotgalibacillus malaysiensis TaxID=1508404 RepID=A0A0B5AP86_9BACL|nr:DUF2225 domain-containing protein [Jeotgalibacillus malaysiensis]AJD91921.1 hypothetical protein JMA_26040 [Jeotgalibacillus malaysiensis]